MVTTFKGERERYVDAAYRECQGKLHSGRITMKYPCETCMFVRYGYCANPKVGWSALAVARPASRLLGGCGNGRRHSGYVSVWRRVWRRLFGRKAVQVKPEFDFEKYPQGVLIDRLHLSYVENAPYSEKPDFENEPREAGLWR